MTCPHCQSDDSTGDVMEYHGDCVELPYSCNRCSTSWSEYYPLENPAIEVHHRGCDCKGNGCIECAPERDPDEKYEQQNEK